MRRRNGVIKEALASLKRGKPVIVYDKEGREEECDIFFLANKVTPEAVRLMRKKGGGLICVSLSSKIAQILELPYLRDLLARKTNGLIRHLVQSPLPYDARSTFSLTVNHVETYTGITDNDRSLTISKLGELCAKIREGVINEEEARNEFLENFRAPGHVFLLRGAGGLLRNREGHTELSLGLALLGSLPPCIALVEMLDDNGGSRSIKSARRFAEKHGIPFLKGEKIIEEFKRELVG